MCDAEEAVLIAFIINMVVIIYITYRFEPNPPKEEE
jgi:hypothetical protein